MDEKWFFTHCDGLLVSLTEKKQEGLYFYKKYN